MTWAALECIVLTESKSVKSYFLGDSAVTKFRKRQNLRGDVGTGRAGARGEGEQSGAIPGGEGPTGEQRAPSPAARNGGIPGLEGP